MNNKLIQCYVHQFKDTLEGDNWLDENFKKKMDAITEEQVFTRPMNAIHSIAELIAHLTVWRRATTLKLKGQKATLTMESPENWRTNQELKKIGWGQLKEDFYQSQQELINFIENKEDSFLDNVGPEGYKFEHMIGGLIHHDLYHLGQMGITIKLIHLKNHP
ncbi:hypothetical protein BH23BAC1_BH23BAC1_29500 [soil metagenome]